MSGGRRLMLNTPIWGLRDRAARAYTEAVQRGQFAFEQARRRERDRLVRLQGLLDEIGVLPGEITVNDPPITVTVDSLVFSAREDPINVWTLEVVKPCPVCAQVAQPFPVYTLTQLGELLSETALVGCNECQERLFAAQP